MCLEVSLELTFAFGDMLHHFHFFSFVTFGRGCEVVELDSCALSEVLSDLFSAGHEILQLGSVDC